MIIPDVADNASIHIDLEVAVDDSAITIWSYLNSPKAISKLKTKIKSRGDIKLGLIDACRLPPELFKEINADVSQQEGSSNFRLFMKGA